MRIEFDKKLKTLRKTNGITQEQLSAHLSISPQAISKWERGEGYPDIALLPDIAAYFGITVDELLGTDQTRIREKIDGWKQESEKFRSNGDLYADIALWKNAYSEYPREPEVMGEYLAALWREFNTNSECGENASEKGERIIKLGEDILACSTENRDRDFAIQILSYTYQQLGNMEKALEYADMQGEFWYCRELNRCMLLKGEGRIKESQYFIFDVVDCLALTISLIEEQYTLKERIEIIRYVIGLYQGIYDHGDFSWVASSRMRQYNRRLSKLYAEAGDRDNSMKYLADAARFAQMSDQLRAAKEPMHHSSPLASMTVWDPAKGSKNYTCNESALVLDSLKNKEYDPYRDDQEFLRIKSELETLAAW